MSINSELQRLDAVRDALVESVNSKGGSLPEDATLWQVKAGVDAIEQGGSVDISVLSATPEDVLDGKIFYGKDSEEPQTGTIPVYTELPDLTPQISWSGTTVTISTPVGRLKTGFYDISGLEVIGHSRFEMLMDSVKTETVITTDRGPAVKLTYDGGWHYPIDEVRYLDINVTQEQEITPGTEDIEIPANRWIRPHGQNLDKGIIIKGDADLVPENIRAGAEIFGVTGTAGAVTVPECCVAYLGSDGCLYVRKSFGNEINVFGLELFDPFDSSGEWKVYGPFPNKGPFAGSVLSTGDIYLEWEGFSDHSIKYTIHTLIGDPGASGNNGEGKYAWGFDKLNSAWMSNYEIAGLEMYWRTAGGCLDGAGVKFYDGWHWREILKAGLLPAAFTWDGPGNVAVNLASAGGDRYKRTLVYPYDEEMGMSGTKYIVGDNLYFGIPGLGYSDGTNGAVIGGFALELNPEGYTDGASYISPLLDGTYKNL